MRVCQLCAFVVALIGTSQAMANSGQPSQAALDAMGLAGLQVMSDVEGLAVRGLGFNGATAYGHSWASVSSHGASAGTKNGYKVSGKYLAGGRNESEAELEIEIEISGGHNGGGHNGGHNGGGNSGGWGNKSKGGHGNKKSKGGHKNGGHSGGGHSKPKTININVEVSAGGSSFAYRK